MTTVAKALGDATLPDRQFDEPVARFGDRQGQGDGDDELRRRQRLAGFATHDLVDRPVVEVQPVTARTDPVQHRDAEHAAQPASLVGDTGDHQHGGDAGEQEPTLEQGRIEPDAELSPALRQPHRPGQPAEQQQSDHAGTIEEERLVVHRAACDVPWAPHHRER